jgi:hypothetical protein
MVRAMPPIPEWNSFPSNLADRRHDGRRARAESGIDPIEPPSLGA